MEIWWSASGTSGKAMNPIASPRREDSVKLDSRTTSENHRLLHAGPMMAALDITVVNVAPRTSLTNSPRRKPLTTALTRLRHFSALTSIFSVELPGIEPDALPSLPV